MTDLFNVLTGLSPPADVPAAARRAAQPARPRFLELIDREIEHAAAGRAGPDRRSRSTRSSTSAIIEALYRASQAGVDDRPHRPRRSCCAAARACRACRSDIRVRSIVGEFLEHSRIWRFANGGEPRVVHRLGRPDGPQPRPAGRGGRARSRTRGPGAARRDHRRHAGRRPPVVAARAGSSLAPDRGDHGPARAPSTRSRCMKDDALDGGGGRDRAASTAAPASARSIRARDDHVRRRPTARGRAEVPGRRPGGRRALPGGRRDRRRSSGTRRLRSSAGRGPLRRHADGALGRAGLRRPAAPVRSTATIVAVKSARSGPSGAGGSVRRRRSSRARPTGRRRPTGLAGLGRPVARPRAVRRRAARRARDDPPAPAQADRRANGTTRVELSLDEVDVVVAEPGRSTGSSSSRSSSSRAPRSGLDAGSGARCFGADPALGGGRDRAASSRRRPWPHVRARARRAHPADERDDGAEPDGRQPRRAIRGSAGQAAGRAVRAPIYRRGASAEAAGRPNRRPWPPGRETTRCDIDGPTPSHVGRRSARTCDERGRRPDLPTRRRPDAGASRRRRSRRRGRAQGAALPPRADDRARGGHAGRRRPRGSPRDARRDPPPARGVARLRCVVPGRVGRSDYRNGLREIAARLGAVRDLDVLLEAADTYRADLPVVGAAGARAAPVRLARAPRGRPGAAHPRARLGRLSSLGRRLPRLRPDGGCSRRAGRADRAAPRPRHGRVADLERRTSRSAPTSRSCAGPTSRRSTSSGSPASGCATRSSSSARRSATTPRR